jgi:hypothetical protein
MNTEYERLAFWIGFILGAIVFFIFGTLIGGGFR